MARAWAAGALLVQLAGCAPGLPHIEGAPGAAPNPGTLWPVPPTARTPAPPVQAPGGPAATEALAADSAHMASYSELGLTDVIALALRNSPLTRASWATARAAADIYGASRGSLLPTITGNAAVTRTGSSGGVAAITGTGAGTGGTGTGGTGGTGGRGALAGTRTEFSQSLALSYLLFDLGGRSGSIHAAEERAIAANLEHNATVRDVVLQAESSLFNFLAARALRDAQEEAVREAQADETAARERFRLGVATIQDVLQTQTAAAQAQLQLETLEGSLATTRGNLAVAMGLRADARFEVPPVAVSDTVAQLAAPVDALVARAIAERPEVSQLRAQAAALAAEVRVARSAGYPALTLNANGSHISGGGLPDSRNYTVVLGLQIPIFNGFTQQYDVRAAREQYAAGLADVASLEQQVSLQVFTSYFALEAATNRVRTAADLLAVAERSATVAAGRYRAGVGTIVDVILARQALATARADAIQARWEWRTALAQLAHDTGSLDLGGRPNIPLTPGRAPNER